MRVLMAGMDWYPNEPGGLNRYVYGVAQALAAAGVTGAALVSYLLPGQAGPLPLRAMAEKGAPFSERMRGARRQAREALRAGVDLANPHFAPYAYPWLRDLPRNVPLVAHFHGPWAGEMAVEQRGLRGRARVLLARRIERAVYRRAARVITLSRAFAQIACQDYGVPQERLCVIPGGVDLSLYQAAPDRREARARLGWPQEAPILLSVRRLWRRMGLESLIDAMLSVRCAHPQARLLIGGTGPISAELEARIQKQDLAANVQMLGFIPDADLPLAYAAADLSLVPTLALEGFGLITVESLAAGTPVLGTPIGGTPEILAGLSPDLIFASATPADMAERIDAVLAGRIALPDAAQCRAYSARYGWPEVLPRLMAAFHEALPSTGRPAAPPSGATP
ncbi:MAG TPA: glycosyltransferase family 4 protein [Chthonomonadaceae bacterium]|nr:glycosyltransferase family 4 protein [Chthonomonadaceae bacterium]